jgi:hypothetical protein
MACVKYLVKITWRKKCEWSVVSSEFFYDLFTTLTTHH